MKSAPASPLPLTNASDLHMRALDGVDRKPISPFGAVPHDALRLILAPLELNDFEPARLADRHLRACSRSPAPNLPQRKLQLQRALGDLDADALTASLKHPLTQAALQTMPNLKLRGQLSFASWEALLRHMPGGPEGPAEKPVLTMDLSHCRWRDRAWEVWKMPLLAPRLTHLSLREADLWGDTSFRFFSLANFPQLRHLDYSHNFCGGHGANALRTTLGFPQLVDLNLSAQHWRAFDLCHVCGTRSFAGLTSLRLANLSCGYASAFNSHSMGAFCDFSSGRNLRRLDLSGNKLRSRHVKEFVETASLYDLEFFDLSQNLVGETGARALAGCRELTALTELRLRGNRIGPGGASGLLCRLSLPQLRALDIADNELGPAWVRRLARQPRGAELQRLNLCDNPLSEHGQSVLLFLPPLARVREVLLMQGSVARY